MRILFFLLFSIASLQAQTDYQKILIYPELDKIIWQDPQGKRVIDSIPLSIHYAPNSVHAEYSTALSLKTKRIHNTIHIICSNGDALFYLYSSDNGKSWKKEVVDHFENYNLQEYDYITGKVKGIYTGRHYLGIFGGTHLDLDSAGQPHLCYTNTGGNYHIDCYVIYAHRKNGKWQHQKVLTKEGYPKRYLGSVAFDLDHKDQPYIIAHSHEKANTRQHSLSLFSLDKGAWKRQIISQKNMNGITMRLRIDSKQNFHFIATDEADSVFYFYSDNFGKSWTTEFVKKGNCRCILQLDEEDRPHAVCTCYNDGIYYVNRNTKWSVQLVEKRNQMCHANLTFNPEHAPVISFFTEYHGPADIKMYTQSNTGKWALDIPVRANGKRGSSWYPSLLFNTIQLVPENYITRKVETQQQFISNQQEIKIRLTDYAQLDQDSISISFNGKWVVENHLLSKEPLELQLQLSNQHDNLLLFHALNEGLHPPNTALVEIQMGDQKERFKLSADLEISRAVLIQYIPPPKAD